jgi:hypothetical protein
LTCESPVTTCYMPGASPMRSACAHIPVPGASRTQLSLSLTRTSRTLEPLHTFRQDNISGGSERDFGRRARRYLLRGVQHKHPYTATPFFCKDAMFHIAHTILSTGTSQLLLAKKQQEHGNSILERKSTAPLSPFYLQVARIVHSLSTEFLGCPFPA